MLPVALFLITRLPAELSLIPRLLALTWLPSIRFPEAVAKIPAAVAEAVRLLVQLLANSKQSPPVTSIPLPALPTDVHPLTVDRGKTFTPSPEFPDATQWLTVDPIPAVMPLPLLSCATQ